jgi:hypothetical protein
VLPPPDFAFFFLLLFDDDGAEEDARLGVNDIVLLAEDIATSSWEAANRKNRLYIFDYGEYGDAVLPTITTTIVMVYIICAAAAPPRVAQQ